MRDDPYAPLAGLDQRLYNDGKPRATHLNNATTKQRDNETTPQRGGERGNVNAGEEAHEGGREPTLQRTHRRSPVPTLPSARQRILEATRTPASARTGHLRVVRAHERHSHDIYTDQVRWMNRLKLDVLDAFDAKVTSNAIVQLAIDMIRDDYVRNGEESLLIRVLVKGEKHDTDGVEHG